jgi:hypothetical protein
MGSLSPSNISKGKGVSFGPLPSPPPSRNPSPEPLAVKVAKIENLCSALSHQNAEPCCLGYLDDEQWQYHIFLSAQRQSLQSPQSSISLHQVLSGKSAPQPVAITPKDRYELAFLLSSSILQLYKTPWLNDNWTRDEIYLLYAIPEKALARNIYVSKSFPKSQITLSAQADPDLALIRNVSVFNLGLALLELTYGHPIEYYQSESDLRNGTRTAMTNMLIAQRLIGQIEEYEGKRYSDVVYRCIYCDFGTRVASFENAEFRQKFYKGVVVPLESIFHDFVR